MNLFKSEHMEAVCPSCKRRHSKRWQPLWWKHDHYKTLICECGYKIFIRTKHMHSGHY